MRRKKQPVGPLFILTPHSSFLLLSGAAFLAALLLYTRPLLQPVLSQDDFQILAQSWTWQKTLDDLWAPNNEHAMPLGRLLTFAVAQLAGRPTALPFAGVLTGVVGLFAAMALTYRFVRRELGHPFYGLTALILFGVSSVYQQAVFWFAASFSVFALAFLLLALPGGAALSTDRTLAMALGVHGVVRPRAVLVRHWRPGRAVLLPVSSGAGKG